MIFSPTFAALLLSAYLIGAVPFGYLIGRAHGRDIRSEGSGNIGATNVRRVFGKRWGYFCLALDLLKGLAPALLAGLLLPGGGAVERNLALAMIALAAVVGHVYPVYLRFRGGKGVATTVGAALGVFPHVALAMLVTLIAYAGVRFTTGIVSAGSLVIGALLPLALLAVLLVGGVPLREGWPLLALAVALGALIFLRHRENIGRLLRGEERRIA